MITTKKIVKGVYKTLRSIIFSLTLFIVGIYVLAYTLLAIPSFTNWVKDKATVILSEFLGGEVKIQEFKIYPFNETRISGLQVFDQDGEECLYVETIGAGIRLWKLITEQEIDLTFGEIIGLDAKVVQKNEGQPLNIDFILKAFSGNDNKEKKPFHLSLKNVVLRKSSLSFKRPWLKDKKIGELNLADLEISDLAADISFPLISDSGVEVDLRRLSFALTGKATVNKVAFKGFFGKEGLILRNFEFEMPQSRLALSDIELPLKEGETYRDVLSEKIHSVEISNSYFTPSEFAFLFPPLSSFNEKMNLYLDARGNISQIYVDKFDFGNPQTLEVSFKGEADNISDPKGICGDIEDFNLILRKEVFERIGSSITQLPPLAGVAIDKMGAILMTGRFAGNMEKSLIEGNIKILSDLLTLNWEGSLSKNNGLTVEGHGEVNMEDLDLQAFVPSSPLGNLTANIMADGKYTSSDANGEINLTVDNFELNGKKYDGLSVNVKKDGEAFNGDLIIHNGIANAVANFGGDLWGEEKQVHLNLELGSLNLSEIINMKKYEDYLISGSLYLDAFGKDFDDIVGNLQLDNFSFSSPDNRHVLKLNQLTAKAAMADSVHTIELESDWFDIRAEGMFKFQEIPEQIKGLAGSVLPSFVHVPESLRETYASSMDFDMLIKKNNAVPEFFNLPVKMLVPINIEGTLDGTSNTASFTVDVPYLQQGKDKLIYDSRIVADIDGNQGFLNALITTTLPVKKGDLALNLNLFGHEDVISSEIHWINTENNDFRGLLSLNTELKKNNFTQKPEILTEILPSVIRMGTQEWNISRSNIDYSDKNLEIKRLKVGHDDQKVEIDGVASADYQDAVKITLVDIDVDYIFDMLQINYVTFGGVATGEISGRALFSGSPVAETEGLLIKQFTYNGANLGQCVASSRWNNNQKQIEIGADISKDGSLIVRGEGGIWLGRDSLSFDLHAFHVPVDFVQPFMAAFSSNVTGYATGDAKLFGTFHDIDMTGKVYADSVAVALDFTNTVYQGSDTVFFNPGVIEIPHFTLHDKFGNTALLTGELTHTYFHDPYFTFRLSEAKNLLCYDTNSDINPDWYGTLFGTGSALVRGTPGFVDISADMTVSGNSNFTFVLNETQYAQDYPFLTFSDKKKVAEVKKDELTPMDFKAMLKKNMQQEVMAAPSRFGLNIRASITPQVLFTLVMDPAAGDKITARGKGAMQVKYESDNDEMTMYGKYEIDEGNYNFSLQDIILRDFKIKDGSSISFNGDPLAATLDISATYRVNTNLTDLDKSFSTDRDLNRTNVPVDAVLSVNGNMQHPDITFDIELPTLTQDVERKVKSIISTDDMMNRQIIYLLALNRFYTPEYMGAGSNGGELAAVASSTISSQLSNILGQLTDKFSVSPSFRSDKGDFSDIEVDVALSSKLLNNRLLINGNFGYRDRSNSSTTFVGDFDVEYLLSKNGNLRLKAYNHFNDQNYYLREALTTQGLGVIYRKDFDDWFTFLKRRHKSPQKEEDEKLNEENEVAKENNEDLKIENMEDGTEDSR